MTHLLLPALFAALCALAAWPLAVLLLRGAAWRAKRARVLYDWELGPFPEVAKRRRIGGIMHNLKGGRWIPEEE